MMRIKLAKPRIKSYVSELVKWGRSVRRELYERKSITNTIVVMMQYGVVVQKSGYYEPHHIPDQQVKDTQDIVNRISPDIRSALIAEFVYDCNPVFKYRMCKLTAAQYKHNLRTAITLYNTAREWESI